MSLRVGQLFLKHDLIYLWKLTIVSAQSTFFPVAGERNWVKLRVVSEGKMND